ncbi:MAG: response regulator [Magnetococcales bacterium]|nr:response regulator [Magnetococcales bacterium]
MNSLSHLATSLGINPPVRVLLVEDSPVAVALLKRSLSTIPEIQVVGTASHGEQALEMIPRLDPQVICTDLHMPVMDGLEFTRTVMDRFPRPILVISVSVQKDDRWNVFQLFEAGAMDVFPKPMADWLAKSGDHFSQELAHKIILLAGANQVTCPTKPPVGLNKQPLLPMSSLSMVVIGGSLGGPHVIKEILSGLPADFPAPIFCVQHMDEMFQEDMVFWLRQHTPMAVQLASHGEVPFPGSIYFPPRDHHLTLDSVGRMVCSQAPPLDEHRPSITVTMESVANHYGANALGILLSGVGNDGVRGLEAINRKGGVTIVQDEASSLVYEMPRKAIEMGAAQHILSCTSMAQALVNLAGHLGEEQAAPSVPVGQPDTAFRNLPVLLVEDSPTQAFKLKRMLTQKGFAVTLAKDGVEGLEKALDFIPRLVISDVSMPRMDGFQLCRALKNNPITGRIPVMLLTALTNPSEILEGLSSGADNYLTKPWEEEHLLGQIAALLSQTADMRQQDEGMEITFEGRTHVITSTRRQILDLLLTTYQKAVQQNKELIANQLELKMLNLQLVDQASRQESLNTQLQQEIQVRRGVEERQTALLLELESVNKELSDFAYVISHDLKAPVRALGSLTNWLITDYSETLDEDGRQLMTTLAGRAQRMEGLINALMEYTQISRLQEELTLIDLDKLVRSIIQRLAIPETMDVRVSNPLPAIQFDKKRAEQLFYCLLDNAVRFMDKENGEILIDWREQGDYWAFAVTDNGPGIDSRYHEKIFGIFQTLQARDELETAGVGLALVRKIVQKYGGEIRLESRPGQGCTFHFTLPKVARSIAEFRPQPTVMEST